MSRGLSLDCQMAEVINLLDYNSKKLDNLLGTCTCNKTLKERFNVIMIEHIWFIKDFIKNISKQELQKISDTYYTIVLNNTVFCIGSTPKYDISLMIKRARLNNNLLRQYYKWYRANC